MQTLKQVYNSTLFKWLASLFLCHPKFIKYLERLHGRVVKGVGHLDNDEAMEAGGRESDPRPGHYSRKSF